MSALRRRLNAMRKRAGIPQGRMTDVIYRLSGERVSKKDCYRWIAQRCGHDLTVKTKAKHSKHTLPSTFFSSLQWRKLRYEVIRDSNGCCSSCGRNHRDHAIVLHVDHIKPRSLYPELALRKSNLQILCEDCNIGKGNSDEIMWRSDPREL